MDKKIPLSCLVIIAILVISGCTSTPETGSADYSGQQRSHKELSANIEINSIEPISLIIYNQNNFDWTNAKATINNVWTTEIGDLSVGDMKVLIYGAFEDGSGTQMPWMTNMESLKLISDEGSAVYYPVY